MRLLEFFRPFRVVATRRVSEEEQISVEVFRRNLPDAETTLDGILSLFRDHRRRTNEEVVRATQQQLTALDTAIKARGETLAELDAMIEKRKQHPLLRNQPRPADIPRLPENGKSAS